MGQYIRSITFILCTIVAGSAFGQMSNNGESYVRLSISNEKVNTTSIVSLFAQITKENDTKQVALSWSTYNEEKVKRFDVWRSFDGTTFERIDAVPAKGGAGLLKSYSFSDTTLGVSSGLVFYRIRQVSKNGSFDYVDFNSVDLSK